MVVDVLASGSSGNSYVISDKSGSQLLLECGIKYEKILPHIDFEKLTCLLVSHSHLWLDHSLCKNNFVDYFRVVSPENDVVGQPISIENWTVVPIQCYHNVDCFGYIIWNKNENKSILFCTDTRELPKIADRHFDLMMLECNYNYDKVIENSRALRLPNDGYKNHLALETLTEWLSTRENKPTNLMAIHISTNGNLDRELAQNELSKYAENFYFAKKGVVLEIW